MNKPKDIVETVADAYDSMLEASDRAAERVMESAENTVDTVESVGCKVLDWVFGE